MAAFILDTPWHGAQKTLRRALSKLRQNRRYPIVSIFFAVIIN